MKEVACKQVINFMGIKQQAEKFGLGAFEVKLFRLEKIDGKAENYATVTKAQLEMELPFLNGSPTSELNGWYSVSCICLQRILSSKWIYQTSSVISVIDELKDVKN